MDFLLKQRLVGAIVLVALGVIFIPMLLEGPEQTLVPEMEALPEPVDQQLSKPLGAFPAPDDIPSEPEESIVLTDPEPEPEPAHKARPGKTSEPVQPVSQPEPISPPPQSEKKPIKPGPLGSWVLQAGSFSSQQNALRLRDKLRKAGFVTQVEKARVGGKSHYRVRVGPFLQRADAEKSQTQLLDKFSLKGRVLSYP
ncbi:MAG: SPOR domain-containing protein [Pseudomonadota bacterium]|nr:SPOR domain-containing protein [Pseudomonadota bacterium]